MGQQWHTANEGLCLYLWERELKSSVRARFFVLTGKHVNSYPSVWGAECCLPNTSVTYNEVLTLLACCTLQLMELSLENLRRNCNPATLFLFINELAVIWFGRQN